MKRRQALLDGRVCDTVFACQAPISLLTCKLKDKGFIKQPVKGTTFHTQM